MATQVIGSLAVNNLLPIQARAAGQVSFGPVAVPAGYSFITIQFDLQQVQSLTAVFAATVQVALDGVNFQDVGGVGLDLSKSGYVLTGGILTRANADPFGPGPVRVFGQSVHLMGTDLTTRQVRGTISCSEAVTAGVTVMAW